MTKASATSGFTLIEIMVALSIVSVGLLAISSHLSQSVDVAQQLQNKTVASWVASNRMSEIRMSREFRNSGSDISHQSMAGRDWKVVDSYFSTPDPNIARVLVEVYSDDSNGNMVIGDVGYLARYKPETN